MSQIEAVIFDMDGVIVDSEPYHDQSFLEIWQEMGYGDCHGIHLPDFYGRSDRVLWEAFIEKHHPPQPIEQLIGLREQRLIQLLRNKRPIFDGVPELVQPGQSVSACGRFRLRASHYRRSIGDA